MPTREETVRARITLLADELSINEATVIELAILHLEQSVRHERDGKRTGWMYVKCNGDPDVYKTILVSTRSIQEWVQSSKNK